MNIELTKVAEYQIWANDQIREIIHGLSDEEFVKELVKNTKSVKELCIHIILAIEYNLNRIIRAKDVDGKRIIEKLYSLSKKKLMKKWEEIDKELLNTIRTNETKYIIFPNFTKGEGEVEMSIEDFYFQYLSHTIYHRGQLMTALKKLDKEGKTTDYLLYLFDLDGR